VKGKFYIPHSQWHVVTGGNLVRNAFVVVRTTGDPMTLAGSVRGEVRALDPTVPVANVRPMAEVVSTALATPRLTGFLLGAFAVVALVLAGVGIYGVLSYLVSRRTHEIGIRLAIGAGRSQVMGLILGHGLRLTSAGLAIGLVGAFALARLMQSVLYDVRPTDPETYVAVVLVLAVAALLASVLPALRAVRVDPVSALRSE